MHMVEKEPTKEEEAKLDEDYGDSSKYSEANFLEPPPSYDCSSDVIPNSHSQGLADETL